LPGGIRFGVLPIEMYYYTIGYNYKIEILTEKEEIISISTKVYFGIGSNKRINMYNDIIDSLWTLHFEDLLNEIDDKHLNGSEISIGDITLKQEGANLLSGKKKIRFDDFKIDNHLDHFSINSKTDSKLFTNIYYLTLWNSFHLFTLLDHLSNSSSSD
jgi:hypothetical protein